MRILVTGGAGFIGSHIADRYIGQGHEVMVIDRQVSDRRENLNPKARVEQADLTDFARVTKILETFRPEIVNHHAAQADVRLSVADPVQDAQQNILASINLFEQAARCGTRRVIFASSGGAGYGEQETFPAPETHPSRPESPYGISKVTAEMYLYYYGLQKRFRYTVLRYANIYGPRQNHHGEAGVVAIFATRMLRGEPLVINGDGLQTRDYVYVDDVVEANDLVTARDTDGIFNIGTGTETDVLTIYRTLARLSGYAAPEKHAPAKAGEQRRSVLDPSRIGRALGWKPTVDIQEGLRRTMDWYRERVRP